MIFSCSFFLYLICAPSPWFSMQHFATTKKLSLVLMSSLGKAEHVYNKYEFVFPWFLKIWIFLLQFHLVVMQFDFIDAP